MTGGNTGRAVFKATSGQVGAITGRIRRAEDRGVGLAAEHVLGVSRTMVPIEEHTLEESGVTSVDAGKGRAAISYNTPYARVQHEDLTLKHDAGRSAKYLERAVNSERAVVLDIIARTMREEF